MSRRTAVIASLAIAVVAAVVFAAVLLGSGNSAKPPATVNGASHVAQMLDGIPQHGTVLGNPHAPVTLVEFADPQCPYCGDWAKGALPTIVDRYVRPGKVRLVFVGMSFVGPDSATALKTALAAGGQGRFWNVLELLYENQGTENTGWVTDPLLRAIGAAVPGLDTGRMLADRSSSEVARQIAQADGIARTAGVTSTPSFAVGKTGRSMQLVPVSSLDASALTPALDAALSR